MNDIARYHGFPLSRSVAGRQAPPPPQQQQQQQQQQQRGTGIWSIAEHDRFLDALKKYPLGPWKAIAEHIGSRSIRQVQTHAQKYQEKVLRRLTGSSKAKVLRLRQEHRIDHDVLEGQSLLATPGERRWSARKASAAKLSESGPSMPLRSQPPFERSTSVDEKEEGEEEDAPTFDSDLFRLSLSEFDDEIGDAMKLETGRDFGDGSDKDNDGDDEEEESDLPSLSECLDFFIKCFSATSNPHTSSSTTSSSHSLEL